MAYTNPAIMSDLSGLYEDLKNADTFDFGSYATADSGEKLAGQIYADGSSTESGTFKYNDGSVVTSTTVTTFSNDTQSTMSTQSKTNPDGSQSSSLTTEVREVTGETSYTRTTTHTDSDGNVTGSTQTTSVTDENGNTTTRTVEKDAEGNVVKDETVTTESDGNIVENPDEDGMWMPWEDVFGEEPMGVAEIDLSSEDDLSLILSVVEEFSTDFF